MPENADDLDERALCARAAAGDTAAQARLYQLHATGVYTMALRILRHPQAAEEALQDTFVKALTKLGGYRGEAAFATWIRRVAVNECLQALRSPWRQRSEPWLESAGAPNCPDQQIDLDRALGKLGATTRAVVWLHEVEGFTHKEIAAAMGRSASFSKSRLARGYRQLREQLSEQPDKSSCIPVLNNS